MNEKQSALNQNPQYNRLYISLARNPAEVAEAQRLRYKVFADEMGAQLSGSGGLDVDPLRRTFPLKARRGCVSCSGRGERRYPDRSC